MQALNVKDLHVSFLDWRHRIISNVGLLSLVAVTSG